MTDPYDPDHADYDDSAEGTMLDGTTEVESVDGSELLAGGEE
jgi:hypothetical protein